MEYPPLMTESDVLSIIALGDLPNEKGLQALGAPLRIFDLKSGEAVHGQAEQHQKYPKGGGGYCFASGWKRHL